MKLIFNKIRNKQFFNQIIRMSWKNKFNIYIIKQTKKKGNTNRLKMKEEKKTLNSDRNLKNLMKIFRKVTNSNQT